MSASIAARAHSGATLSGQNLAAPVRRAPQARRASVSPLRRIGRMIGRKPGRTLMLLMFSAVAVAILVNAMLFQKARHPAPIISMPAATTPQRQAERRPEPAQPAVNAAAASASTTPLPPSRPGALAAAPREAQPAREAVASREASAPRPPASVTSIPRSAPAAAAPAPAPARTAAARDPIADLINGTDMRPPADIKGAGPAKAATPRRTAEN